MSFILSSEFKLAFDLIEFKGESVFITGKAGTGKSTFLNYLVKNSKKNVVVLAPTGVAAVNVGGQTIHSFFGLPPGCTVKEAVKEAKNRKNTELFVKSEVIVIDEISMIRSDLMDCINVFLQTVMKSSNSFGGKQMVFIGDLCQLPPIVLNEEKQAFKECYASEFFFDSIALKKFKLKVIKFNKIYRQKDKEFIELLNKVREKNVSENDLIKLNSQVFDGIDEGFIHLTSMNYLAEEINSKKLNELTGIEYRFKALIEGKINSNQFPAEQILSLKKGAQVMFLANNVKKNYFNGMLGTVIEINGLKIKVKSFENKTVEVTPYDWEIKKYKYNSVKKIIEKELIGVFTQIPLRLAWAITIHKSQGKTFEKTIIDVGKGAFTHGQLYVALSRNTSLQGIKIKTPIKQKDIILDKKIINYMK
ncbi:MAG: AAA family ATPase [Candidatus Diapherotrites archaeon]|nr:AAA family ATPase [Candidatus Diapherotrites archaeon]